MQWIICHIHLYWVIFKSVLLEFHNNNDDLPLWTDFSLKTHKQLTKHTHTQIFKYNALIRFYSKRSLYPQTAHFPPFSPYTKSHPGALILSSKLFCRTLGSHSCVFWFSNSSYSSPSRLLDWSLKIPAWHFAAKCSTQLLDHLMAFLQVIQACRHTHTIIIIISGCAINNNLVILIPSWLLTVFFPSYCKSKMKK